VVRDARLMRPIDGSHSSSRDALIARLRSADSSERDGASSPPVDLRKMAYVETDHPSTLAAYLPGVDSGSAAVPTPPDDVVSVHEKSPACTVVNARLRRPGLLVLADRFDPGWRLTIDGRPATILRANLLMRAAAVDAGSHTLVFTYKPASVQLGAWLSLTGLACVVGLILGARRQRPGNIRVTKTDSDA
jgi:hypothetical protein